MGEPLFIVYTQYGNSSEVPSQQPSFGLNADGNKDPLRNPRPFYTGLCDVFDELSQSPANINPGATIYRTCDHIDKLYYNHYALHPAINPEPYTLNHNP